MEIWDYFTDEMQQRFNLCSSVLWEQHWCQSTSVLFLLIVDVLNLSSDETEALSCKQLQVGLWRRDSTGTEGFFLPTHYTKLVGVLARLKHQWSVCFERCKQDICWDLDTVYEPSLPVTNVLRDCQGESQQSQVIPQQCTAIFVFSNGPTPPF